MIRKKNILLNTNRLAKMNYITELTGETHTGTDTFGPINAPMVVLMEYLLVNTKIGFFLNHFANDFS
jgi:hypothetical protein